MNEKKNKRRKNSRGHDAMRRLFQNKGATISGIFIIVLFLIGLFGNVIFDYETQVTGQVIADRFLPPSLEHPFGTDNVGRDLLIRVLYGARFTLPIALSSTLIAMVVGVVIGAVAGFYGGVVDNVIMRIIDIWSALPGLLLTIMLISIMGIGIWPLVLSMAIYGFTSFARITRAAVIARGNEEYAEAARAVGATDREILFEHIIPNSISPILVEFTLRVGTAIISCSAMSYLGLGVEVPNPEWGALLSAGRDYIRAAPWLCIYPGITIVLVVVAFNQLGDGLRDALDPKLKR